MVEPPGSDPPPHGHTAADVIGSDGRRPRWRRWPFVAVALLVSAGLAARPSYDFTQRAAWHHLLSGWAAALALDQNRQLQLGRLADEGTQSDGVVLSRAAVALYAQEAVELDALAAHLGEWFTVDGGLRRLTEEMQAALRSQARALAVDASYGRLHPSAFSYPLPPEGGQPAALEQQPGSNLQVPPVPSAVSSALDDRVYARLVVEQRRFGGSIPLGHATLTAADPALSELRRWLGRALPDDLVVNMGGRLAVLDLTTDSVRSLGLRRLGINSPAASVTGLLVRGNSLAVAVGSDAGGRTWAVPLSALTGHGTASARLLGPGTPPGGPGALADGSTAPVPGPRPNVLWLAYEHDTRLHEVTTSGRLLGVSTRIPDGTVPTGLGVGRYLVLGGDLRAYGVTGSLQVTDPRTGRIHVRLGRGCALPIAGGQRTLAWADCALTPGQGGVSRVLFLYDLPTGQERRVSLTGATLPLPFYLNGALSPNGRLLAVVVQTGTDITGDPILHVAIVNVRTAVGRLIRGATVGPGGTDLTWAPDGRRIFFFTGDSNASLATWSIGAREAVDIRYHTATTVTGIPPVVVVLPR